MYIVFCSNKGREFPLDLEAVNMFYYFCMAWLFPEEKTSAIDSSIRFLQDSIEMLLQPRAL